MVLPTGMVSGAGGGTVVLPAAVLEGSSRNIQLGDQEDITQADAKLQQTQQMMRVT